MEAVLFFVAALLEGRNFIGIEKNQDVKLFKKKEIDYVDVCKYRPSGSVEDNLVTLRRKP